MSTSTARPDADVIVQFGVEDLIPSKTNRTLTATAIDEMAESIKKDGILQPITARPISNGKTEIVFGECRWRGAKKAGLAVVPVVLREYSDEEAQRAQIIENLQRSNPTPIDEAESYDNLRKLIGKDATFELVAAQVGKSASYVAQRLKLLELIPDARKALLKEAIGLGHALLIAPLDGDVQKAVVKWLLAGQEESIEPGNDQWGEHIKTVHTEKALRAFIERNFFLDLSKAPFDIHDAKLVPQMGACTGCPHNTVNSGSLFPDHSKKAVCTLPSCFYEKRNNTIEQKVQEAEKDGTKVYRLGLGNSSWNEGPGKVKVDGYLATSSYQTGPRIVKPGDECKTTKTAVLVFRASDEDKTIKADLGDTTLICTNGDCSKHGKRGSSTAGESGRAAPLSGLAFVSHKQSLLKQSLPERLRWVLFKALDEKLQELGAPVAGEWKNRIEWLTDWAKGHLSHDCVRDACKALGLWDKKKKSSDMPWRQTFAKHYDNRPWAYSLAILGAAAIRGDTWEGKHNPETNNLFRLCRSFRVNIVKLEKGLRDGDAEAIKGMRKNAEARAQKAKAKKKTKVKAKVKVAPKETETKKVA